MSHNPAPQTSTKTSGPRQRTAPRFTRRRRRKAAEAAAVVDRLTFNAHIINTGTNSYRLRTTAARKRPAPTT